MLTSRRITILKAVVDEFIDTAEPVSSKILVEKYRLPYSSATIRNEMAALESEGYLEKPHTSAGRIPSNKGYQFYCEHLGEREIDDEIKYALSSIFDASKMNIEETIKESCKVISDITNLTSGVLGPDASKQKLERVQLIPVDERTAVCVLVTNEAHTEHKVFNFSEQVSMDDLKNCTDIINDRLKGTALNELNEKLNSIRPLLVEHVKHYDMLFNAFAGAFMKFASSSLYVNGTSNMMYQPEFADIERLKDFINKVNDSDLLKRLMGGKEENQIALKTDEGTEMIWMDNLAVISNNISVKGNKENLKLMVIGPSRMKYDKVVSLLDFIRAEIEKMYD